MTGVGGSLGRITKGTRDSVRSNPSYPVDSRLFADVLLEVPLSVPKVK